MRHLTKYRLNLTQKYQVFFFVTGILPIVLFTLLYFGNTYTKFNANIESLLKTGLLHIEDAINDNLHELTLSTRQAATLSVGDIYNRYHAGGSLARVKQAVSRYYQTNHFDIVVLVNEKGQILHNPSPAQPFNAASFALLAQKALEGQNAQGIQRYKTSNPANIDLAYVSIFPIFSHNNPKQAIGALMAGRYVSDDPSLKRLSEVLPEHTLRFVVKSAQGYQYEDVSFSERPKPLSASLVEDLERISDTSSNNEEDPPPFNETAPGKSAFLSQALALRNPQGHVIGFIVLSIKKENLTGFLQDNFILFAVFLLAVLGLVFLGGSRLKRDIVLPLILLAQGAQKVTHGNLGERIPLPVRRDSETGTTITSFNTMLDKLEENEQLRTTFITTLTHDLRTPLLAQQRVVEILLEDYDALEESQRQRMTQGLLDNNRHLLDMVSTMLEVYQYEDGNITLQLTRVNMPELVDECMTELKPLADHGSIELFNRIPRNLPLLEADRHQLKRVFMNLLGNAVQNMPKQRWVEVSAQSAGENTVEIIVKDNGPGLPPEVLENIFERYGVGHRTRKKIGSGLGLYICRMIVELHDGNIQVNSVRNEGTTFSIRLPIHHSRHIFTHPSSTTVEEESLCPSPSSSPKITN